MLGRELATILTSECSHASHWGLDDTTFAQATPSVDVATIIQKHGCMSICLTKMKEGDVAG